MKDSKKFWRSLSFVLLIAALCGGLAIPSLAPVRAAPISILISQVYGGGGNSGAPYLNDYIELFNPTSSAISINGWSVQYASAAGTTWTPIIPLSGSVAAGQYYLVQLASGGAVGSPLPTPDATGTTNMAAGAGKVALANTTTALTCGSSNDCLPNVNIIDFVGYGSSASSFEGSGPAPAPSNTTSDLRGSGGCTDVDNNSTDFALGTPTPRNSSSPINICPPPTATPSITLTPTITPTTTVTPTTTATSTVTVTPTSTTTTTSTVTPTRTTTPLTPATGIVISEFRTIGASGGNDEFVELFNPTAFSIPIDGWTINKSAGCGGASATPIATIPSGVTLAPGQHYLIGGTSYSGTVTPDLPNQSLSIANDGGIALLNGANIIDQVGLCSTTFYREGTTLFPLTTNVNRSYDRNASATGICVDSNNNLPDFFLRTPSDPQNWSSPLTTCGNPTLTPTVTRTPTLTRTPTRVPTQTFTPTSVPVALVAINEFVPRPARDWNNDGLINTGDEFIEIINHGTISVNLSGYTLDDEVNEGSDTYSLPSITLDPGERIVFYGSETGLLLSDGGDGVRLLKPSGALMDAFNYTVVKYPDQAYCRLPDNGGLDDWNVNCYPTPGLRNALGGNFSNASGGEEGEPLCPIADTLPLEFYMAECDPFGNHIWSRLYWDDTGWYGEMNLPEYPGKWQIFVD